MSFAEEHPDARRALRELEVAERKLLAACGFRHSSPMGGWYHDLWTTDHRYMTQSDAVQECRRRALRATLLEAGAEELEEF